MQAWSNCGLGAAQAAPLGNVMGGGDGFIWIVRFDF